MTTKKEYHENSMKFLTRISKLHKLFHVDFEPTTAYLVAVMYEVKNTYVTVY